MPLGRENCCPPERNLQEQHWSGGKGRGDKRGREGRREERKGRRGGKGRRERMRRAKGRENERGREEVGWKKKGGRRGDNVGTDTSMYSRHTQAVNTHTHRVR